METLKDFFQSLMDSYKDRIKSPLIGSFILTYLIFNWRAVAILFYSDWPVHCRIEWIDNKYCNPENYLWPLAISLFYVLGLPYINIFFEWVLKNYSYRKKMKTKNTRIDDLEQKKEEAKLLREIADAQAGISEINNLKERNDGLTIEINSLIQQNKEDTERHKLVVEELTIRENDYHEELKTIKNDNKVLRKSYHRSLRKLEFLKVTEMSDEMAEDVLNLDDSLTTDEKTEFLEYAKRIHTDIVDTSSPFIEKMIRLKLLKYTNFDSNNRVIIDFTELGKALFMYLKYGYDLM